MGRTEYIVADGTSAVTQFVDLVLRQQELLDNAAARDAEAIRILTSPALPEVVALAQRRYFGKFYGHCERRIITRRDERRLACINGWRHDWWAPCRVEKLISRFGNKHIEAYRAAMDEVRRDGTASVVAPKLAAVKSEHDALLEHARTIGRSERIPLPRQLEFNEAHAQAVSALIDETRPPAPAPDGPVAGNRWRHAGKLSESTLQQAAWRLVAFLWDADGRASTFDELIVPVYDDPEHIADSNAFGSLRRAANEFFKVSKVPLRVALTKSVVRLESA